MSTFTQSSLFPQLTLSLRPRANTLLVGLQNGTVTLVNRLAVPELPFDPAILFLGIYLREMKTMATQKLVHECSQQCYS